MPLSISILNISGYEITKIYGRKLLIYEAKFIGKVSCPFCGSANLREKDRYIRVLNHETIGHRKTMLYLEARKYKCLAFRPLFQPKVPRHTKIQKVN